MPVILWTDALVFLLVALGCAGFIYGARDYEVRKRWRKIYQHPTRMIAMLILACFMVIGFLDCLHYRSQDDSTTVNSVLDWVLRPISVNLETSYSAPFATQEFVSDLLKTPDGHIEWVNAKLQYIDPVPIWPLIFYGVMDGLIVWIFITAVLWLILIKKRRQPPPTNSPWFIGWLTMAIIWVLIFICKHLMAHYHIFGTDKIGTDVFYASLKSIRTGLIIGTLTTVITLPFAVLFGAMAGYFRGWVDDIIQYIYTTLSSIPGVLLIAAAMLSLDIVISRHADTIGLMAQRSDLRLLLLCSILGITSWSTLCRILRGETLKLREQEFILAAKVMGLSDMRLIMKHVVPNLVHIILISLVLDFSGLVLAEAVLSYVGVGVDPSMFSWGNMINGARMELGRTPIIWWSLLGAFILMFALVLSANIFADGVRDAYDPRVT